jgi:hypothetical protein
VALQVGNTPAAIDKVTDQTWPSEGHVEVFPRSKPDNGPGTMAIDVTHQRHLLAFLPIFVLIDAD